MSSSLMLDHAVALARLGIAIINVHNPIFTGSGTMCDCRAGPQCRSIGKHPMASEWAATATTDIEIVKRRWTLYPSANIGIPTGLKFGKVVLDADGDVGVATLMRLEESLGALPLTVTALTPSGGQHRVFAHDGAPIHNSVQLLGDKVDVRGQGGQVVAAPSLHRSGKRYAWLHAPSDTPLARLPQPWIDAMLNAAVRPPAGAAQLVGAHRGPSTRPPRSTSARETRALLSNMLAHPLITWMLESPDAVSRVVWRGVAVNFAAAVDGHDDETELAREAFHTISEDYARYCRRECDGVFRGAFDSARNYGPMLFTTMIAARAPKAVCVGGTTLIHASRRMIGG